MQDSCVLPVVCDSVAGLVLQCWNQRIRGSMSCRLCRFHSGVAVIFASVLSFKAPVDHLESVGLQAHLKSNDKKKTCRSINTT